MATIMWPMLVTIVGGGLWGFSTGKAQDAGRMAFQIGLFWVVYLLAGRAVHL